MKLFAFIILAFNLMTVNTEAGFAGAFAQLSEAAPAAAPAPEAVPAKPRYASGLKLVRSAGSQYWDRIECWQDYARPFVTESVLNKSRHDTQEIVAAFGGNLPKTSNFLLHYGPRWSANSGKVVILVHGASDNANRAWATPAIQLGDAAAPGLLQTLENAGHRVFALTFPHKHGSLFYEAQYLADAIDIVLQATGESRVTLIGHSAGGLVARVYVSGYRAGDGWTPYRGEVENLITIATPHRGQDFIFRHPEFNYFFIEDKLEANAPMSWDKTLYYGKWYDTFDLSIYSDNFPMQQQVLYDWSGRYPVSKTSPDYYTTLHGGQGFVSHSQGITNAVARGGNFMNTLRKYPVPADIEVSVIAGKKSTIENVPQTETDGPSDGLVFLESASHTADLTHPARTTPVRQYIVDENHVTITFSPSVMALVADLVK